MIDILRQMTVVYWEVLSFKRLPQATPSSPLMLGIAVGLTLLTSLLKIVFMGADNSSVLFTIVHIPLFALYAWFVLWTNKATGGFLQLMICWLMMLFFLNVLSSLTVGGLMTLSLLGLSNAMTNIIGTLEIILVIVFSLWQVTYVVNLFRAFLQQGFFVIFMVYIGWLGVNYLFFMAWQSI